MSKDLGPILEGWPHEPGQVTVRKIRGLDGNVKIQLRVDLGVLQMEAAGRPDGQRPYGCESLLDHLEQQLEKHRQDNGTDEGFFVDEKHCDLLRAEAVQYYYRYLSEFVLEDYDAVVRDTARNLRALDFCGKHAREDSDRFLMEQYRPYILMMNARARSHLFLRDSRPRAARRLVLEALEKLRQFYARFGQEDSYSHSSEVSAMESLLKEIEAKIPPDPIQLLKHQLAKAIEEERYEEAAKLRDTLARATEDEQGS